MQQTPSPQQKQTVLLQIDLKQTTTRISLFDSIPLFNTRTYSIMGNTQTSASGIPIESATSQSVDGSSGVRITGSAVLTLEDKLKEAYEQGKQEGVSTFQSTLEVVAAQVYDNVHSQLSNIQKDSLDQSQQLVSSRRHLCFFFCFY